MSILHTYTPDSFTNEIEDLVIRRRLNYLDAIMHFCEVEEIDPDRIPELITAPLKQKLRMEGEMLHLLKKSPRLMNI